MDPFWEQPDVVERFAGREPDHRLVRLAGELEPGATRVLDLGCAGGRNAVFLAERGFDVWAMDASRAMVERTRLRLVPALGTGLAARRARVGRMDDLSAHPAAFFDLVVALGIYHLASTRREWERAIDETARVLKPGGMALVNQFTPEVDLTGSGVRPVEGEPDVYEGMPSGRAVLLDAASLDAEMSARGLRAVAPSETVRVATEKGIRVSVNAVYRKR